MNLLANHSDSPLVTAQVMCHSGDLPLLGRALDSVRAQTLPLINVEVQIVFDGKPTEEEDALIREAIHDIPIVNGFDSDEKEGYYCGPRNRAFDMAWGFYMAHLDADNEWKPDHLVGLLEAIRTPGSDGLAHFVYARREYVKDEGVTEEGLVVGPSPLTDWTDKTTAKLALSPRNNFIDTGDFLIGKSTLVELAERTGCVWDSNLRRFGDWDLVSRLAKAGIRGRAVNQVSHVYHWTGNNLQLNRFISDVAVLPQDVYDEAKRKGLLRDN